MSAVTKIDINKQLNSGNKILIELGCGRKKKPGRIGIDRVDLPGVDIVADIEQGLPFLPDKSVDEIHCRSVLEHLDNFEGVLREIIRVLKDDGRAYVFVPHFSNPYYYSDYTHVRFFGLYTFYYFVDSKYQLRREVPDYYSDIKLLVISQKLVFRSNFRLIGYLKKAIGRLINLSTYFQEYYEENLAYLIPAHGIELVLSPAQRDN